MTATDWLDGGSENDQMTGGLGNDIYYVDTANDKTFENAGEGTDTVYTSVSWTLSAETEVLRVLGNTSMTATGNGAVNTIVDGGGNSLLRAGHGRRRRALRLWRHRHPSGRRRGGRAERRRRR